MLVIDNNNKVDNGDIDIDIDGGNAFFIEGLGHHRRRRRCKNQKVLVAVAVLVMTSIVLLLVVATTTATTTTASWYYRKPSSTSTSTSTSTSISRLLSSSFSYLSSLIITTTSTATRTSLLSPLQNMNIDINSSSSILFTTEIKEKKQKQKQKQTYEPHCNNNNNNNNNQHQHQHQRYEYEYYEYEAPEPYEYLNNCCDDRNFNPYINDISPDPLISMTWNNSNSNNNSNNDNGNYFTPLQIYRTSIPIKQWYACEDENNNNNTDCVSIDQESRKIQIRSNATIGWDWGSERSSWFELISINTLNLVDDPRVIITGSISEFNTPYPGKTLPLIKYGNHTYRLETNKELYEGIRYTFLHIKFIVPLLTKVVKTKALSLISTANATTVGTSKNDVVNNAAVVVEINDYSIVSKIKPIEYTGQFYSSNKLLTKAYYWGACE